MATDHLLGCHDDCLDRELAAAHVEEVFETRSEQVNNEDVVKALLTKVVDLWYPSCTHTRNTTVSAPHGPNAGSNWGTGSETHENQRGSCMSGIHLEAGGRRSSSAPAERIVAMGGRPNSAIAVEHTHTHTERHHGREQMNRNN
jgi:hypothetical protein